MISPAIVTIARREIRDTLSDWRILLPIFILTFILPQLIMGAVIVAVDFLNDKRSVIQLMPFAILLVGFIPASFSLITALEAFVGERERNSLEALLAMPISDNDLYAGKLFSSLLPPLLSSYLAMTIFGISFLLVRPDMFFAAFTPDRLLLVLILIGFKALVMVAGAVIISSHTSSVRAANLLASFVLIPMSAMLQIEALLVIASRWDVLWMAALGLLTVALILGRTGIKSFNREEILSREHEQFNFKTLRRKFTTFFCEYQPAGVTLDRYQALSFSPARFYRYEIKQLLRECRLPIAMAGSAALIGLVLGVALLLSGFGHRLLTAALQRAIGTAPEPNLAFALLIFANNLRVSLLSNALSAFAFGIFAFLVPTVAFAQIGYVSAWLVVHDGNPWLFLAAYILPHGIIELPAALLSAGLGLRIGASLMAPPSGFSVGENLLWALANYLKVFLLLLVPLFFLGSLIEGLLTPLVIRALY